MEEDQIQKAEKQKKEKLKKDKERLPSCTTASSAEHSRAHDDDEPCDDARAG